MDDWLLRLVSWFHSSCSMGVSSLRFLDSSMSVVFAFNLFELDFTKKYIHFLIGFNANYCINLHNDGNYFYNYKKITVYQFWGIVWSARCRSIFKGELDEAYFAEADSEGISVSCSWIKSRFNSVSPAIKKNWSVAFNSAVSWFASWHLCVLPPVEMQNSKLVEISTGGLCRKRHTPVEEAPVVSESRGFFRSPHGLKLKNWCFSHVARSSSKAFLWWENKCLVGAKRILAYI